MLVVCTGTATEVGKTWVGASVLSRLRSDGVRVSARKPAQSFDPDAGEPTDAELLGLATGEPALTVCAPQRWYPVAFAPPMAADSLAAPTIALTSLVEEVMWPTPFPDVRWVETVGGVRSPIAHDGDSADLCDAMRPDIVVLVADAGLGTINAVRTSIAALGAHRVIVFLNRYDPGVELHERNRAWLAERHNIGAEVDVAALAAALVAVAVAVA